MFLRNILLIVGFVALLGGGVLTVLWVTAEPTAKVAAAANEIAHASILIAAHPIATGTLLRSEDVTWKTVEAADASPAELVRTRVTESDYVGAVARRDFGAGEALVSSGIVKRNERGFLAAVLAPGKRAVSIAVDASQSSSGLVLPGDHVDVILTQSVANNPANATGETVGETVLHDLRVIAVDQSLSAALQQPALKPAVLGVADAKLPKTVTLEVSERDAEKLFVAGALGKLDLAVRALETKGWSSSSSETDSQPVWGSDVSAALKSPHRAPSPAAPAAPGAVTQPGPVRVPTRLEVMHGAKTESR